MQLLNKINTVGYTNQILRQKDKLTGIATILRADNVNTESFRPFSDFKQLVLDIGRQVNADIITDIAIIHLPIGKNVNLGTPVDGRIIVALETQSIFAIEDRQINLESGSIVFTDENLNIINTSNYDTYLIIIDFKEFIIL